MKLRSLRRTHPPCSATRSLLAAVCGALLLVVPVAAVAQSPPTAAARAQRGVEANLLVLEVRLDGHVLSDSLVAYQDGAQVLLPLGELARLLTLGIQVQPASGTASGFVIREERAFALSANESLVTVNGRQKSFEPRLVAVIGDDVYVSTRLLAHWLPLALDVDLGRLQLDVRPRERLPLQERLEREESGARLGAGTGERADPGYPLAITPHALFGVPFIDQTLAFEGRSGRNGHSYEAAYTGYFTGDLLGMEGSLYVSTHKDSLVVNVDTVDRAAPGDGRATAVLDRTSSDLRITLARHDPDANLLGPLHARTAVLGSIVVPSVPNVMLGSPHGNGVLVSNRPLDQPTSFDRHTFRGDLPPGWDVTLYYNDALIGFETARPDGQYAFNDLPLSFGPNEFRLVFNGPLGQVRVERQSFLLDQSVIAPGQTYYSLLQHRTDNGNERTVIQVDYGLTRSIALNGALVRKPSVARDDDRTYAQAGVRGYFESMILGAQVTQEQGRGTLAELALKTRVFGYALDFIHLQRQGRYDSDLLVDPANSLRYRDTVRANGAFKSNALPPVTIAAEANREVLPNGDERIDAAARVSTILRGTAISNSFAWYRGSSDTSAYGTLQLSRRMFDLGLSTQVGYSVRPAWSLDTVSLIADRALGDAYRLNAGVQRTMHSPLTLMSVGLSKNLGSFGLGLSGSYTSRGDVAIGLQFFVAMGRDPRSGAWSFDAQPLAGSGAVSARAFVDKNMNGVRDPGEELVADAGFLLNGGGRHPARTDVTGTTVLGRLQPGQYTDIALDPTTLEDPQWKPLTPGIRVLPRPGVVEVVEFPVVATSEIDGTVFLVRKGERRGIGAARIELVDEHGRVVAAAQSSGDGYYLLHQVLPGRYSLRIAPDQADRLGLGGKLARTLTVPVDGDFINGQDFELTSASR